MRFYKRVILFYVVILCCALSVCGIVTGVNAAIVAEAKSGILQPTQPTEGPGGSCYSYETVETLSFRGKIGTGYCYYPSQATEPLPVIVFVHGYDYADQLPNHNGFIEHLVRKGYLVVYPNYQYALTLPSHYAEYAAYDIKAALSAMEENRILPASDDTGILFGFIGYSAGGVTSMNLAADYVGFGIPKPRFVVTIEGNNGGGIIPINELSTVEWDTNLLMIVGDREENTYLASKKIWEDTPQIPAERKQWLGLYSDDHAGNLAMNLYASHYLPYSNAADAYDYYGFYKWCVAIANDTFYGTDREYWYGGGEKQTSLGVWSDGVPVRVAVLSDSPFFPKDDCDHPVYDKITLRRHETLHMLVLKELGYPVHMANVDYVEYRLIVLITLFVSFLGAVVFLLCYRKRKRQKRA